ncbi:hypothetical protein PaG_03975 [Moesziomyces aphidis]|uniref:GOLD domain-containing protein n=1 Tax=Moesziomyces aphidis TaxID=84754 RepID=W3VM49_MOEAP|nr:hypothetical protein PaG_03975 [Moesziomyces aphidis]
MASGGPVRNFLAATPPSSHSEASHSWQQRFAARRSPAPSENGKSGGARRHSQRPGLDRRRRTLQLRAHGSAAHPSTTRSATAHNTRTEAHKLVGIVYPTARSIPTGTEQDTMLGRTNVLVLLCTLLLAVRSTAALYFYLEPDTPKCFLEELPNDTVVVGHYMTEEWDTTLQRFVVKDDMGIHISVREVRDDHVVTSSRGPPEGKFAFTSHEAGDHRICMLAKFDGRPAVQVRMHLDIVIGDAKPDNSHKDKAHVTDLAQRVRDLNALLRDIRKEQQYQREREAQFRDLSEVTNSRAMWWSSLQLITLLGACVWQLRHLRGFFEDKKLR